MIYMHNSGSIVRNIQPKNLNGWHLIDEDRPSAFHYTKKLENGAIDFDNFEWLLDEEALAAEEKRIALIQEETENAEKFGVALPTEKLAQLFASQQQIIKEASESDPESKVSFPGPLKLTEKELGEQRTGTNYKFEHKLEITEEDFMGGGYGITLVRRDLKRKKLYYYGAVHDSTRASVNGWSRSLNPAKANVHWQPNHLVFEAPGTGDYKIIIWKLF